MNVPFPYTITIHYGELRHVVAEVGEVGRTPYAVHVTNHTAGADVEHYLAADLVVLNLNPAGGRVYKVFLSKLNRLVRKKL